ncbi:acetate/propionate family kinase [Aquirhabdus parva]|uniref:Acetate kinase n=1 Tax=Aquirhabdus parva TaxID=2283318 RepID=A0A345P8J8_9GAMM|nr:acetate kinase [Aquirhabdus parva]AXI03607.1 acetate kinase [Aquirhabdus parva]
MSRPILVINCGSSSIKFALVPEHVAAHQVRRSGLAENLGTPEALLNITTEDGKKTSVAIPHADHQAALTEILKRLGDELPIAIGHRVVHGGEKFTHAVQIDESVLKVIRETTPLAPLHNPANLQGIDATLKLFADLPQVAVFDTAFHQTMPPQAFRYALPEDLYSKHHIRRYGFHGTSHAYVTQHTDQLVGGDNNGWISAHLGNGCSTCAVWQGKSMDTSMGLTPLEGLVMGTRSGNVDPSLHIHLTRTLGWSLEEIDQILNKKSGLLGLSGLSNDMRTLTEAAADGHRGAELAIDVFCYRLAQSLAAMSCALPVFTGIIFTGGIGENAAVIRAKTLALLPHFGLYLDADKNQKMIRGAEGRIDQGANDTELGINAYLGRQIWVIPTDEEGQIARETRSVLGL